MDKPFWSWQGLFRSLGIRRLRRPPRSSRPKPRQLRTEPLEARVMLTTQLLPGEDELREDGLGAAVANEQVPELPSIRAQHAVAVEGEPLVFKVELSAPSQEPVSVKFLVADGTARAGKLAEAGNLVPGDFEFQRGKITFEPGKTEALVNVLTTSDELAEGHEHVWLLLYKPKGAEIAEGLVGGTILDNDLVPSIDVDDTTVAPGGTATFLVTLSNPYREAVTVEYATQDLTARAGKDYEAVAGTLRFEPGETLKKIAVPAIERRGTAGEQDRELKLVLTAAEGGLLDKSEAVARAVPARTSCSPVVEPLGEGLSSLEGDGQVALLGGGGSAGPTVHIEPAVSVDEDAGHVYMRVSLSSASEQTVSVSWRTEQAGADPSSDYEAASGWVYFEPSQTEEWLTVAISNDAEVEGDEDFWVLLEEAHGAELGESVSCNVTIIDNDTEPEINIYGADGQSDISQGDEGQSLDFYIVLSNPSEGSVAVDYHTEDGTARAGSDYTATSGRLTISAGSLSESVSVETAADNIDDAEEDETFSVVLENASNGWIGDRDATGMIHDVDAEPLVSFYSDGESTPERDGEIVFTVSLSHGSEKEITVYYETGEASGAAHQATADQDYSATSGSVVFAPYDPQQPVSELSIAIPLIDDEADEYDEDFAVTLSSPVNASLGEPSRALGTIQDDDAPPTMSDIPDTFIWEDVPTSDIEFTIADDYTPPGELILSGNSSNTALVPNGNIVFGGMGAFRTVTITPAPNQFGTTTITVTVTDGDRRTTYDSFVLVVYSDNDFPVVVNPGNQTNNEGDTVSLQISASDVEDPIEQLTFTASGLPDGLSISSRGLIYGQIKYTEAGDHTVTVTATDTGGLSGHTTFTWTVQNAEIGNLVGVEWYGSQATSNIQVVDGTQPEGIWISSNSGVYNSLYLHVTWDLQGPMPKWADILYTIDGTGASPSSGDFASSNVISFSGEATMYIIQAGVDLNLDGTLQPGEWTRQLNVRLIDMATCWVEGRRDAPGEPELDEAYYPLKSGEHFDIGSTFEFQLGGPDQGVPSLIRYELWDTDGINEVLAEGAGTSFSHIFNAAVEGDLFVRFYADANDDGEWSSGEQWVDSEPFEAQYPKVYSLHVDVSSLITPAPTHGAIEALLNQAEYLLRRKDDAEDWRAAVDFRLALVTTFTATGPIGARPDPVDANVPAQYEPHWDHISDIVFVDDIVGEAPGQIIYGFANMGVAGTVVVDWGSTSHLAIVIAHEMGHSFAELDDYHEPGYVMESPVRAGLANNVRLTKEQADAFD